MVRILIPTEDGIPLIELLLDETLCKGEVFVPKELVRHVGGVNTRLCAKQKYELLLRIAQETSFNFENMTDENVADDYIFIQEDIKSDFGWQTDCFVVGKYSEQLREQGYFEPVIESLLQEAAQMERYSQTLEYLEQMIRRSDRYYQIDDATRPILIYKGDDVCHNILTVFAEQFGKALEEKGALVTYFDTGKEEISALSRYIGKRFKAIIGVQTYLYKIKVGDGEHELHEYIHGPKYNFIFDHPVWAKSYISHSFPDFCVLTHDENYVQFIRKYYRKNAIFFPPAGMEVQIPDVAESEREYDLSFVGTCGDYRNEVLLIHQMERKYRFLANKFLLKMRKNPNATAEWSLMQVLKENQLELGDADFLDLFYELRRVIYCVMHYYRHKVLRQLLESGIRIDVFGNSWQRSDLRRYPNLVCHGDVTVEESLAVWNKSKLSLNVMSWHKGGFTERMCNIMLAGAVLVTDRTTYLEGRYNENEIVTFRLDELERMPELIKKILNDDEKRREMTRRAYEKTKREHTWERRAEEFLALLDG